MQQRQKENDLICIQMSYLKNEQKLSTQKHHRYKQRLVFQNHVHLLSHLSQSVQDLELQSDL